MGGDEMIRVFGTTDKAFTSNGDGRLSTHTKG